MSRFHAGRHGLAIGLCAAFAAPAFAEEAEAPPQCSTAEYAQLDFWLGTWDLTWADGGKGQNIITKTLDGCVITEDFQDFDDQGLLGHSVSTYSTQAGGWRQLWVDNQGGYLPFSGGPGEEGFQFVLDQGAAGQDRTMRMIWLNVEKDSLDWHWQSSPDSGQTWEDRWVIHYERRAK